MIETSVDVGLLASLYSSQLITKDKRSLLENDRTLHKSSEVHRQYWCR